MAKKSDDFLLTSRQRVARLTDDEGDEAMITAWHFMADRDGKPILRDGRPAPAVGEWLVHDGPILMCASGLHASVDPIDAMRNAPGPWVARVECDEVDTEESDKFVCRRRRILWTADATPVLRWFARRCALDVVHMWDAPDVVVRHLRTGDESLRDAAWDALRGSAWDVVAGGKRIAAARAEAAARYAVRAAWGARDARNVAGGAARAAASARYAMSDAEWNAAKARQSRRLRRGLMTLTGGKR